MKEVSLDQLSARHFQDLVHTRFQVLVEPSVPPTSAVPAPTASNAALEEITIFNRDLTSAEIQHLHESIIFAKIFGRSPVGWQRREIFYRGLRGLRGSDP